MEELVKVMERKSYNELEIYTEISLMSKELRDSILQMKRYYRFDVGDEIRSLLRELKYLVSDIHQKPNTCKYLLLCELQSKLNHLEIALSDCLEDRALKLEGRYNISSPLSRLAIIKRQAESWKSYIGDKYGKQEE